MDKVQLQEHGYSPIRIETEEGRKEYQVLQQQYAHKTLGLRQELAAFCGSLRAWHQAMFSPRQSEKPSDSLIFI